jgi:hypothetical protein
MMSVSTPTFDLCVPRLVAAVREVLPQADFADFRVVRDMHGRLYLVVPDALDDASLERLRESLHQTLGPYSPGPSSGVIRACESLSGEALFAEPSLIQWVGDIGVRLVERRAMGQDWVNEPHVSGDTHPPRFVFHSLKGGVGRSTAMMLWGRELVRQGRTVLLVDLDLEAPGLGAHMLPAEGRPEFGVLDWLVEDLVGNASPALPAEMVAESVLVDRPGLWVAPAMGRRSSEHSQGVLAKLARGYLEGEDGSGFAQRLQRMIAALEAEVAPDVVLIDSRAGLHETVAANLLHLGAEVFFFAVDVPATWEGYRYLLAHLAQLATVREFGSPEDDWRQRFHMVQARSSLRDEDKRTFAANAYAVWIDTLYDAVSPDDAAHEVLGFTFDEGDPDAPHWPVAILRSEHFEAFDPLRQLASTGLASRGLASIGEAAIREAFGELFAELQRCLQLREEETQ